MLKEEIPFLFACPALVWQSLFIYMPLTILLGYSVWSYVKSGNFIKYEWAWRFLYLHVFANSFVLALLTSIICLLIAYPVAYFLVMRVRRFKMFLLFSTILPSWTSFIVQIYSWFFLLQKEGFLGSFLYKFGIVSKSFHMLNNYFAIYDFANLCSFRKNG